MSTRRLIESIVTASRYVNGGTVSKAKTTHHFTFRVASVLGIHYGTVSVEL